MNGSWCVVLRCLEVTMAGVSRRVFLRGAGASLVASASVPIWYDWLRAQMQRITPRETIVVESGWNPPGSELSVRIEGNDWFMALHTSDEFAMASEARSAYARQLEDDFRLFMTIAT